MTTKPFRQPDKHAQEWRATKYDSFKLVKLGEYKMQKGSGRSQCFELAKDGMIVATWTKKCAEAGFDVLFPINCVQKLLTTEHPGWGFSDKNAEGLSYKEVLGSRTEAKAKEKKAKKDKPKRVRKPKHIKGTDSMGRVIQPE
jgi:hypothetical protein